MSEDTSGIIVVGLVVTTVGVLAIDYAFSDPGNRTSIESLKSLWCGKKRRKRKTRRVVRRGAIGVPRRPIGVWPRRPTTPAPRTVVRPPVRPRTVSPPQRQMLAPSQRQMFAPSERPYTTSPPSRRPLSRSRRRRTRNRRREPSRRRRRRRVPTSCARCRGCSMRLICVIFRASSRRTASACTPTTCICRSTLTEKLLGKDTSRTLAVIQQQLSLPATGAPDS